MSKKYLKKFGDRVRLLRDKRKWSQEDLAHKANLHRTQISLIERGMRTAKLDTILKLAKAFEVQPSELLPEI